MDKCPKCQSTKIDHATPITDNKNKTKFYHAQCLDCETPVRVELDGSVSDQVQHDKSWLDDLSNLIEE
jgi:hypothetical protein